MSRGIEGILDTCLERVRLGGESIEQCLDSYPEHASELEPLLRAALRVMDASSIRPGMSSSGWPDLGCYRR